MEKNPAPKTYPVPYGVPEQTWPERNILINNGINDEQGILNPER